MTQRSWEPGLAFIAVRVWYCGSPDATPSETVPRGSLEVVTFAVHPEDTAEAHQE